MLKNILIPTDGSEVSRKAIKAGVKLAQSLGAKVTGYYAIPFLQPAAFGDGELMNKEMVTKLDRLARTTGQKYLDEIDQAAKEAGVEYVGLITKPVITYEGIIDAAKKKRCDAIFMASRGRSEVKKLLLGSVTQKVLSHARVPVIVYR
ncbi:MAG: TRAP-T-associated universal stress protein TeaD [Accumulibacter sp.]|jgi:nucleotide-binding universal stress UspA family protein|uniref:universal stress protein n=1 Tax=Accumulibacter sp. TaxID=2053492 RepID=UPI001203F58A|nr:universal stress protein [Accumulibacter sp.]QKS29325.1 MAG: universal stress protein [Candidatus Accumulibacter similis]TLD45742.1 MAG: TRAP-T-associated universal stress protein TeaD [Accumulibacter sp.]